MGSSWNSCFKIKLSNS